MKCPLCPVPHYPKCFGEVQTGICERVALGHLATVEAVRQIKEPDAVRVGPIRKAFRFASSAVRHILAGSPVATPEQQEARLAICRVCPRFAPDGPTCLECGCYLPVKTSWAGEECPLSPPKWGPIETTAAVSPLSPSSPAPHPCNHCGGQP